MSFLSQLGHIAGQDKTEGGYKSVVPTAGSAVASAAGGYGGYRGGSGLADMLTRRQHKTTHTNVLQDVLNTTRQHAAAQPLLPAELDKGLEQLASNLSAGVKPSQRFVPQNPGDSTYAADIAESWFHRNMGSRLRPGSESAIQGMLGRGFSPESAKDIMSRASFSGAAKPIFAARRQALTAALSKWKPRGGMLGAGLGALSAGIPAFLALRGKQSPQQPLK